MTADALINILLTTGIPGLMAALGAILAVKGIPSRRERWTWISLFCVLFVFSIGLSIAREIRATNQQKQAEARAAQAERERVSDTQYMKGKLDTISAVMAAFASRSPGVADLTRVLSEVAKQSPEETAARRRAEAQSHLGTLLTEGMKLTECYEAKDGILASPREAEALREWERRTRAALAVYVNPALLSKFGEGYMISVVPGHEKWLKTLCWATRHKAFDLQAIMAQDFSPVLTEAEKRRRASAQAEVGKVLGEGQLLYDQKCTEIPSDNLETPPELDKAISAWEGNALSVVAGSVGPAGMEEWDRSGNAYPGKQTHIRQRCGQLEMRLVALRNVMRISFGVPQ